MIEYNSRLCEHEVALDDLNIDESGTPMVCEKCREPVELAAVKDVERFRAAERLLRDMERDFREGGITDISNELYARIVAALSTPYQALEADYPQAAFARGVRHGLSCPRPATEYRVLAMIRQGWEIDHALRFSRCVPSPEPAGVDPLEYATRIAVYGVKKFAPDATTWKPLDTLVGVLTQIDNLLAGTPAHAAAPGADLIAWAERTLGTPNEMRKDLREWVRLGETCADGLARANAEVLRLRGELEKANPPSQTPPKGQP
jgi:hypothetical protein